jgi:hypothetical protein
VDAPRPSPHVATGLGKNLAIPPHVVEAVLNHSGHRQGTTNRRNGPRSLRGPIT